MAIASIALASLYRTVGQSSKGVADVEARVEAALLARSLLAGSTFAEDLAQQQSGDSGIWHWNILVEQEQVRLLEETGNVAPGDPVRAAKVTVDITRGQGGPTVMTWTSWKPYRSSP